MIKRLPYVPFIAIMAFFILGKVFAFQTALMKVTTLILCGCGIWTLALLRRSGPLSPIHKGLGAFLVLVALSFWAWPDGAGRLVATYPAAVLYAVLFLVAAVPPLIGREAFTMYFARKSTPPAVWETAVFKTINNHLTALWALLFFCGFGSGLLAGFEFFSGPFYRITLEFFLPAALMLGIGLPVTRRYPEYYQRKQGLSPAIRSAAEAEKDTAAQLPLQNQTPLEYNPKTFEKTEELKMSQNPTIVAVNGSPHAGMGNTSMMIEMLRDPLAAEGFSFKIINLAEKEIDYCYGCGFCLEKGKCWIKDDHRSTVDQLLSADGIILGSPVYVLNVTGQMKTFLDRSLGYGHKPRPTWKPGLVVCVSAGLGETQTADYLAGTLRIYGAFAVGRFTAMATGPGEFIGRDAVEARAKDLARDLARAVKEKRRHPASDMDLRFYQFMGDLVKRYKDTVMKHDYRHWQKHGYYEGFENYIQQTPAKMNYNPEARDAWIKELIASHGSKRKKREAPVASAHRQPQTARTCAELLQMMPLGFKSTASDGLEAIYQFEISGGENFTAHLKISKGTCTYQEGPADHPDVIVKTPADVWLAISKGELDGQQAFMSGRYRAEGDLSLLMKLKTLFST